MGSDLKAIAHRMYNEVMNAGKLELIDEIVHDDFVEHEEMPGMPTDKEAPREFVRAMRAGFSDFQATIEDIVEEGDTIVVRARMRGTHDGEFMGVAPTGKQIDIAAMDMVRFQDGKAIEHWGVTDTLAMMQQLGQVPEEAPA